MLSQKQMKEWIPEAVESFKAAMPSVEVPYPEIHIGSNATWLRIRDSVVSSLRSNQSRPDFTAALEVIRGKNGSAILIYQQRLGNHVKTQAEFNHVLWHELGHFYADTFEDPTFCRFLDQKPHPDEIEAQRGYYFWTEFIAETIACKVDPEPNIDWGNTYFYDTRNMLMELLKNGIRLQQDEYIDWYDLAFYFAKSFSDKRVLSYLEAIDNGTLKYRRTYFDEPIPFRDSGIDPLCLDCVDKSYHTHLSELSKILKNQLAEEQPCNVSLPTIILLGQTLRDIEFTSILSYNSDLFRQRILAAQR